MFSDKSIYLLKLLLNINKLWYNIDNWANWCDLNETENEK